MLFTRGSFYFSLYNVLIEPLFALYSCSDKYSKIKINTLANRVLNKSDPGKGRLNYIHTRDYISFSIILCPSKARAE